MNNSPSVDDMLEGVIAGLQHEVMPYLTNAKAGAAVVMMQSVLQAVRQILPVRAGYVVEEHNDMTRTLREAAAHLADVTGAEADRIRERAATLGLLADLPTPPDAAEINAAYGELTQALESTIADLDVIQRGGGAPAAAADEALNIVRAHLAPRYLRDMMTISVGDGFVGRG